MGWLIGLGIVALLAALPLGISLKYDTDGPLAKAIIGPVKFTIFPKPKKEKTKKEKTKPGTAAQEQPSAAAVRSSNSEKTPAEASGGKKQEPRKRGGSLTEFLPLVKVVLKFLGKFRRKVRVRRLELKVVMAADDPCDLAVNYGRAWAAMGNFLPKLERFLIIKKRNIEIECDFEASSTLVTARLDLSITLGRLLALAVVHGAHGLRELLKIMNNRKGGAVNESKSS